MELEPERCGAIWIAKKDAQGTNEKWDILEKNLIKDKIRFSKIPIDEARDLTPDFVQLNEDEVFYYEPDALQYDPADVRRALYEGVRRSNITLMEKTEVIGFRKNTNGLISNVITNKEVLSCDHVINFGSGAWAPSIFAKLSISVPVSVEPVYVVNVDQSC